MSQPHDPDHANPAQATGPVYVSLDLETTGLDPVADDIIEVGAVRFRDEGVLSEPEAANILRQLLYTRQTLSPFIRKLTGIQPQMLEGNPGMEDFRDEVQSFLDASATHLIAQRVTFEEAFLTRNRVDLSALTLLDTYDFAVMFLPSAPALGLPALCHALKVPTGHSHRAFDDALATGRVFVKMLRRLRFIPDVPLQHLIAHGSARRWNYQPFFEAEAARRGLGPLGRDATLTPEHFPQPAREKRVSDPPAPSASSRDADAIGDLLDREGLHVITLAPEGTAQEKLAHSSIRWAQTGKRLLICRPRFESDPDQRNFLDLLAAMRDRHGQDVPIEFQPNPWRFCDVSRLNAWKAGRILDKSEARFLTRILHWIGSAHDPARRNLNLHQNRIRPGDLDRQGFWPQIAGTFDTAGTDLLPHPAALSGCGNLAEETDGIVVMEHGTLVRLLFTAPDFIADFDSLVIDDLWHLNRTFTEHTALSQTVDLLDYARKRLARLVNPDSPDESSQWLRHQPDVEPCREVAASLLTPLESARDAMVTALVHLTEAVMQSTGDGHDSRSTGPSARLVAELTAYSQWSGVLDAWKELNSCMVRMLEALDQWLEALPLMDADADPLPSLYIQQLEGLREQLADFRAHVTQVLASPPAQTDPAPPVHWLKFRDDEKETEKVEFHRATPCPPDFLQEHLALPGLSAVCLQRCVDPLTQEGFPTTQLGLEAFQFQPAAVTADPPRPWLGLVAPGFTNFNQPGHQELTARLVQDTWEQVEGTTLVLFTAMGALRQISDLLRQEPENGTDWWQQGLDTVAEMTAGLEQPGRHLCLGTFSLLESLSLTQVDVQCIIIPRLPFPQPNPLYQHKVRYEFVREFRDLVLPHTQDSLIRATSQLAHATRGRGVLMLLDQRLLTQRYGAQLQKAMPIHNWERIGAQALAKRAGAWLRQAQEAGA